MSQSSRYRAVAADCCSPLQTRATLTMLSASLFVVMFPPKQLLIQSAPTTSSRASPIPSMNHSPSQMRFRRWPLCHRRSCLPPHRQTRQLCLHRHRHLRRSRTSSRPTLTARPPLAGASCKVVSRSQSAASALTWLRDCPASQSAIFWLLQLGAVVGGGSRTAAAARRPLTIRATSHTKSTSSCVAPSRLQICCALPAHLISARSWTLSLRSQSAFRT
mmetsp:Transcript_29286/g.64158  ORF Transcript_29286/g.64158 Transcript_29286/m.64158 type:complete len:218 (-) Transcript_29286:383-1036(-)